MRTHACHGALQLLDIDEGVRCRGPLPCCSDLLRRLAGGGFYVDAMPTCPAIASERDYKRPGVALGLRVRVCRHCYARSWVGNIVATACVHAVARTGCAGHTKTCTARSRVAGCVCSTWLPSCSHTQVCGCCARTGAACRAAQTRAVCVSNACCRAQPSAPLLGGVCPAGADLLA